MFCTKCGQKIVNNSSFCTGCGSMVKRSANQEKPNHMYPINPYWQQPHGGYRKNGYRPQRTVNALAKLLLFVVGVLVLLECLERLSVVLESLGYLRYIRVLGYEFIVVYAVKIGCIAALIFGGIRGIAYCGRPDKGKAIVLNAIMIAVLEAADWISVATLTRGLIDEFEFTWQNVVFGTVLPILLIAGGYINEKAIQNTEGAHNGHNRS